MKNCTKISFRKCQVEAGAKILGNGASQMEKLLRTPAKEMGSGLEELQCSRKEVLPTRSHPRKNRSSQVPVQFDYMYIWEVALRRSLNGDEQH